MHKFLAMVEYRDKPGLYAATYVGSDDDINAQKVIVERIWQKVLGPAQKLTVTANDVRKHERERTIRAIETIKREAEIRENLGEDAPDLNAAKMHPWVWDGARSLWQSRHYAEAVEAAAKKLNAETQNKVGRKDISETTLFLQAFSDDEPQPGKARLRLPDDDGGKTALGVRRGIRAFAEGCYAAIRNPLAHDGAEMSEVDALERLAALSMLARWVDQAKLHS